MTEPTTIKARALVCNRIEPDGSGLAVQQIEVPAPGPGQARVRVAAAALNFPDYLMARGGYQHKPPLPFICGLEGAGEIEAVGQDVGDWAVGDRCAFSAFGGSGSMTELALTDSDRLHSIPADMSFDHAAAFPVVFQTAWVSLAVRGDLRAGEWVLVHGASGGVGMACIMLARHLGARVIATCSAEEKFPTLREWGAEHCLPADHFFEQVKEITGGGAQVVVDPVGGDVFDQSLRAIAWGGRLLVAGFAGGRLPTVPANIVLIKGLAVLGVRAGEIGRRNPSLGAQIQADTWRLAEEGLRPAIGARYPLARAPEAFEQIEKRSVLGKLIIHPGE